MGKKKKNRPDPGPPPLPDPSFIYSRARWRHAICLFGVAVLVLLNVATIGSLATRRQTARPIPWHYNLELIALVLFCDLSLLLPMLVEVDKAQALEDKLVLNTAFYKVKIPWSEIVSFKAPGYLKFSVVRTRRCFYLLNKRQLEKYNQLVKVIEMRRSAPAVETTDKA